jgi:BolA protein
MIFESIEAKVRAAFKPTHFELENESHTHHRGGDETHFRLIVVSPLFEGVSRVDRQRQVYGLLEAERSQGLHALAMWTYTPSEWEKHAAAADLTSPDCATGHPGRK